MTILVIEDSKRKHEKIIVTLFYNIPSWHKCARICGNKCGMHYYTRKIIRSEV